MVMEIGYSWPNSKRYTMIYTLMMALMIMMVMTKGTLCHLWRQLTRMFCLHF